MNRKLDGVKPFLESLCQSEKVAGMAVAVTDSKSLLFSEGFGVESCERPEVRVSGKTLFRIASVTKVVTGMTVLSLVEEGKLQLDTPVKAVLPWLSLSNKETEERVTLRHLLSHTSGLEAEYTPEGPREEAAFLPVLQEGLPYAKILFEPGGGYQYSNWGIRLACAVAQEVTGTFFSRLVKERILTPLGMTRTTFDLNVAATYPIALPHTEKDGSFQVCHRIEENAARLAAGGLFSCAEDLCILARCLLNEGKNDAGKPILTKESVDEMKRQHARVDDTTDYGLTLVRWELDGAHTFGHHGFAPPYCSNLTVHPESGLGIITLMNTERPHLRLRIPQSILRGTKQE